MDDYEYSGEDSSVEARLDYLLCVLRDLTEVSGANISYVFYDGAKKSGAFLIRDIENEIYGLKSRSKSISDNQPAYIKTLLSHINQLEAKNSRMVTKIRNQQKCEDIPTTSRRSKGIRTVIYLAVGYWCGVVYGFL